MSEVNAYIVGTNTATLPTTAVRVVATSATEAKAAALDHWRLSIPGYNDMRLKVKLVTAEVPS